MYCELIDMYFHEMVPNFRFLYGYTQIGDETTTLYRLKLGPKDTVIL